MSSPAKAVIDPIYRWVTFSPAGERYGIGVVTVQGVVPLTDLTPVPGSPHDALGSANIRGNVVTGIDAQIRLGLAGQDRSDSTRTVGLEVGGQGVGRLVGNVPEMVELVGLVDHKPFLVPGEMSAL